MPIDRNRMRSIELDPDMVDAALTTTRAVRRRLDLDREVPDRILLDCIDVAEQAPTGGNLGSRRWLIVKDSSVKEAIAEIYLRAGGNWVIERADALADTDHRNAAMIQGARHMAENMARMPALVIPTILGLHDGSGRPGLFDSVIQSGWSFQVALRARGLGSVWTTMILGHTDELRELLAIPADVTPVALFPVAYTVGTDFSPSSRRYPAEAITYWDRFSRTVDGDRTGEPSLSAGPGVTVEIDVEAEPEELWPLVTDINLPARFSTEFQGAAWNDDPPGPGATFTGRNQHKAIGEWETTSHVVVWDPPHRYRWHVNDPEHSSAQWQFEIEPLPGGNSRLRYHARLGPGPSGISAAIEAMPDKEARILDRRQDEHLANMTAVVNGIKALAEG